MSLFSGMTLGAGPSMYNPFGTTTAAKPASTVFPTTSVAKPTTATNTTVTNPTNVTAPAGAGGTNALTVAPSVPSTPRPFDTNVLQEPIQQGTPLFGPLGGAAAGAQSTPLPSLQQSVIPALQQLAQPAPQGFNFATGNYSFGPGTVGKYGGQYVFNDPVTNRYLSTGDQAQAYLRAFGNNGNALTLPATGGFRVGQPIAQGMPQNTISNARSLMNIVNPPTLPAFAGTRGVTPFSRDQAQQLFNYGSQYANAQKAFSTLYDKFLEGTFRGENMAPALKYLQDYSRQADAAQNQYNTLLGKYLPQRPPAQGMPTPSSPLALQTRFTLPKETWDMNPQQLTSWINNYERQMGRDSFLGNAAWLAGPALITAGAGSTLAGALGAGSGLAGKAVGSAIGTGIEQAAGINNRATGGIISLLKKGQRK